ncbi:hypothetical protein LCGC14_1348550 [marine sediment metagenome]|uniref:Uncharacterized protein n=1 Tax=marine sediment metagenome TaxID=412755 RepID=A0A0F9KC68_9ZZZZ
MVDKALTAQIKECFGDYPKDVVPLMGGMDTNPTWDEYLDIFEDDFQPVLKAIREAVEREGHIGKTGDQFCNYHHFLISDGQRVAFSWRAWGDFMQAIVGRREGYMTYYM